MIHMKRGQEFMGKSNRKANLLREMKGGKPQKFIKLPPINKKLPKSRCEITQANNTNINKL